MIEAGRQTEERSLVARLCFFAPFWIRSPSSWNGTGRLVDHLFVRHLVPAYLYEEWTRPEANSKWLCWFILLGAGSSLHRASSVFGWRVSQRFQVDLAKVPGGLTPIEATVYTDVLRHGGTPVEFRCLLVHPSYGTDRTEPTDPTLRSFLIETTRWMVMHRDGLSDETADEILSWAMLEFNAKKRHGQRFSWKGRSVAGSLRHARTPASLRRPSASSTWASQGWDYTLGPWSFVELTSSVALREEGRRLRHCVDQYAKKCASGLSRIISMRYHVQSVVPIEVNVASHKILQVQGADNRETTEVENGLITYWWAQLPKPVPQYFFRPLREYRDLPEMKLSDGSIEASISIEGYAYNEGWNEWDLNWLRVKMTGHGPNGSWTLIDPCLTTFEGAELADWFESVAQDPEIVTADMTFTEPGLEFRLILEPGMFCETLMLRVEVAYRRAVMTIPIVSDELRKWAAYLRQQLMRFPQREL